MNSYYKPVKSKSFYFGPECLYIVLWRLKKANNYFFVDRRCREKLAMDENPNTTKTAPVM